MFLLLLKYQHCCLTNFLSNKMKARLAKWLLPKSVNITSDVMY